MPPLPTGPGITKVSTLELLPEGVGCDMDGDGKGDNGVGKILGIYAAANDELKEAVGSGELVLLLRSTGWATDGKAFAIELLFGEVAPSTPGCDPKQAASCDYLVDPGSYAMGFGAASVCAPLQVYSPATVNAMRLNAGGDKQVFVMKLPVVGIHLSFKISRALITGKVTGAASWETLKDGMLCGIVTKKHLEYAVDAIPAVVLAGTGFSKAEIKSLLLGVFTLDIDADGDGVLDAISIALKLESFAAPVVGWGS